MSNSWTRTLRHFTIVTLFTGAVACSGASGGGLAGLAGEDASADAAASDALDAGDDTAGPGTDGAVDPTGDHPVTDPAMHASLRVLLTDAPGDFEAVPVTIASVEAYLELPAESPAEAPAESGAGGGGDGGAGGWSDGGAGGWSDGGAGGAPAAPEPVEPGWYTLVDAPAQYDLLQLQNGVTAALGNADVPAGTYTQIRLIVADAAVVVDGETHELFIPSGEQTGLKLNYDFDMSAAGAYDLLLDFDAQQSVKKTGAGYMLTPVIMVKSFGAAAEDPPAEDPPAEEPPAEDPPEGEEGGGGAPASPPEDPGPPH